MTDAKVAELYKDIQSRLIGALLYDASSANRVLEIVTAQDFEEPSLEIIFEAIVAVVRRDETPSPVAVAKELEALGQLKEAGGPAALYSMREAGRKYLLEATAELYALMVKEASAKSKVQKVITEAKSVFTNDSGVKASEGIAELQSALNEELYKLSDESSSVNLAKDLDDYLALLDERALIAQENEGTSEGLQGIPSLLPALNQYTGGWLPGQMITVGARTGVGKSIFAVNAAVAAAQAGKSVQFFSLEMEASEIQDRIVSSISGIPLKHLKNGTLSAEEQQRLATVSEEIRTMKIELETEPRVTVDSIRAKALHQIQSEDGLDFIILDYLQLVTPAGKYSSRQEAVADISRNMKILAKQLQVPVMVLVQVNRESKDDENPVPKLSGIRESGAIAQDSDIVILLHRDESLDDTIAHTLVLLEKNRNGEANKTIRCHSNLECSLFREVVKARDLERVSEEDHSSAADSLDLSEFEDMDDLAMFGDDFDGDF